MLKAANSALMSQFFLMLLSIAIGPLIGGAKIRSFSLGVSGGIFTRVVIGYLTTRWTHTVSEGGVGHASAKGILSADAVMQMFSTSSLLLFLVSIGLRVGSSTGTIFRKYGMRFVVIGISISVVSMPVACVLYGSVLSSNQSIAPFETTGMHADSMTTAPDYGTVLSATRYTDYGTFYKEASEEDKDKMLPKIDPSGTLSGTDTATLNKEQITAYRGAVSSIISLDYTAVFPMGVLVIVVALSASSKLFYTDMGWEKENYQEEMNGVSRDEKTAKELPLNFMVISLIAVIDVIVENITILLGSSGSFSVEAVGGVLLAALILSYIGQISPVNFKIDSKALGIMHQIGLTFFMIVVGLHYGCDIVTSLTGSDLVLAVTMVFVEMTAVLVSFFIGRKLFGLSWIILSGVIVDGYISTPDLGAAVSSIGSEELTARYGIAQPFAILTNVLLATIFFNIIL